ncbi:MAG TPA: glycine cleavage system aminomethyltransferase GcvT [Pirellulaceae bacterium]|nr:glycine cleavage system aminomethyltransferase GcvT [Pirellulaceae bacterium]
MGQVLKTPLYDWHVALGARIVEFAGWAMPVQYRSIIEEHQATRKHVGIFDVSHMGRLFFAGTGIDAALDRLTTRQVMGTGVGRIRYSLMTREDGGILDDVLVYHLAGRDGNSQYMMVVNASNREKICAWLATQLRGTGIEFSDQTMDTAMIAVQGPGALASVSRIASFAPADLKYYTGRWGEVAGSEAVISRTGYTGEDGCELIVPAAKATQVAQLILDQVESEGGKPAGLGARDTLRLEAAMPLYGHELSESINAAQTDLAFAINLEGRDFVGRDAIVRAQGEPDLPRRVGLELEGKRAAREGSVILADGQQVGTVTSGTFAPTLEKSIAMGYVHPKFSVIGTDLKVEVRGNMLLARVVKLPFYTRPK